MTDLESFLAEWLDGGLDWRLVERDATAAGLALVQFTDGLAVLHREEGLWGLVYARGSRDPVDAVVGPDRALLLDAFIRGATLPGYDALSFSAGTVDERFREAVKWIAAWRPRDVLGSLIASRSP